MALDAMLVARLALAVALAGVIGLERELRQKNAGLRTHALVGLGAALFIQVSAFGFSDVLRQGVVLDPSRVAAQVASGIGFIGGGLIFVRHASVRGLTTAASVWLSAAVGLAAGAGMWLPAIAATVLGLVVVDVFERLERILPRSSSSVSLLRIVYEDDPGTLDRIAEACASRHYEIADLAVRRGDDGEPLAVASIWLRQARRQADVVRVLSQVPGVREVMAGDGLEAD